MKLELLAAIRDQDGDKHAATLDPDTGDFAISVGKHENDSHAVSFDRDTAIELAESLLEAANR